LNEGQIKKKKNVEKKSLKNDFSKFMTGEWQAFQQNVPDKTESSSFIIKRISSRAFILRALLLNIHCKIMKFNAKIIIMQLIYWEYKKKKKHDKLFIARLMQNGFRIYRAELPPNFPEFSSLDELS
jgi:hypothetical protein